MPGRETGTARHILRVARHFFGECFGEVGGKPGGGAQSRKCRSSRPSDGQSAPRRALTASSAPRYSASSTTKRSMPPALDILLWVFAKFLLCFCCGCLPSCLPRNSARSEELCHRAGVPPVAPQHRVGIGGRRNAGRYARARSWVAIRLPRYCAVRSGSNYRARASSVR